MALRKKIFEVIKLFLTILPILVNLIYYLLHSSNTTFPGISYLSSGSRLYWLLVDLFAFSTLNFSPWQFLPASLIIVLYLLFVYASVKNIYNIKRRGEIIPDFDKTLFFLISILTLIYLLAPYQFGGGQLFNERFPWVILIILLPIFQFPETGFWKQSGQKILIGMVSFFFVFNAVILWQQSKKVEQYLSGLTIDLPKGAYVMTYKKIDWNSGWPRVDVLMHSASYYGILKGCVNLGNYETGFDYFPIHFKHKIPQFPSVGQIAYKPETIDWPNYPSIQYVFGWKVDKNDTEQLKKYFDMIWKEDSFSMWKKTAIHLGGQKENHNEN